MSFVNAILRPIFDLILAPFAGLSPMVSLTLISAVVGIGMLLIFKWTSNQEQLAAVKRRIHAGLFEIRLFNDDLRAIVRAQNSILRANLSYIRLTLIPMLVVIVPIALVFAQLQFFYGYRGLTPGETTLVKAEVGEVGGERPASSIEAPAGLRVEGAAAWFPSLGELVWEVTPEATGSHELAVTVDGVTYLKTLEVSERVTRRSPIRVDRSFLAQFLYPSEPPLEDGPLEAIHVAYPEHDVSFFGLLRMPWWLAFFILTIVFAFALRKRFDVTI